MANAKILNSIPAVYTKNKLDRHYNITCVINR